MLAFTFALAAIATLAVEAVVNDLSSPPRRVWITAGLYVLLAGLARWRIRNPSRHVRIPRILLLAVTGVVLLPVLMQLHSIGASRERLPAEILLLCVCRNLLLGLAALSAWPRCQRLTGWLGVFLVLFASTWSGNPLGVVLVGAYACVGCIWLMASDWSATANRALPLVPAAFTVAIVSGVVLLGAQHATGIATALNGFIPSSGGTRTGSDSSRGGIGDGPDEVAGSRNPKTVGFDNSDVFVNSEKAGLYDAFTENFGKPAKPTEFQKMMMLRQRDLLLSGNHAELDLRSGRSFSVLRQPPAVRNSSRSHAADALLYVKGETPLHLRMSAYRDFDGIEWHESPDERRGPMLENEARSNWIDVLPGRSGDYFRGSRTWQIRIGGLDTACIPCPSDVCRFRMGRVTDLRFFAWAHPGILKMVGRRVPGGTVIDAVGRALDSSRIGGDAFAAAGRGADAGYSARPRDLPCESQIQALAAQWTAGVPRGWRQIESVTAHLRQRCALDRRARPAPRDEDVVGEFLTGARRGPDYLFASATVLVLRELGYPARLVSGFYASPAGYDATTQQTPLFARDTHFWAEVLLADGTWALVEPTPGYDILGPKLPWWQRTRDIAAAWIHAHYAAAGISLLLLATLLRLRLHVIDALWTLAWTARLGRSAQRSVLETFRLVERRFAALGCRRQPDQTPARWLAIASARVPPVHRQDLNRLAALSEWAAYAPPGLSMRTADLHGVCRRIGLGMTAARLKRAASSYTDG